MDKPNFDLHDPAFVRNLFDEMSATYGIVNVLSSFGFCVWWRRACATALGNGPEKVVVDLMCGMGELWPSLRRSLPGLAEIQAVDFSPKMCEQARIAAKSASPVRVKVHEADALESDIPSESADAVISSFGLKTFTKAERGRLAMEVARILKPGGRFSFVEISEPDFPPLRWVYMAYVKWIIPRIGGIFLEHPENYRMLWQFTSEFGNCKEFADQCTVAGLKTRHLRYFFGCATGVSGHRP